MKKQYRVAIVQMRSGFDKDSNLIRAGNLVTEAVSQGAAIVGFPETFNCLGSYTQMVSSAERIPGRTTRWMADLAKEYGIYIHCGSLYEESNNKDLVYNTSVVIAPSGDIIATYRKIHLFDVDLPGDFTTRESKWVTRGEKVVTVVTTLGKIGLSICYDLRFPELYRRLSNAGSQLIFVPAAFRETTGSAHWEVLIRARAIENQSYVLAANQWGEHQRKMSNYGNSMIVNPWGEIIARVGNNEDAVLSVDVDLASLEKIRNNLPALDHRQIDRS